MDTKQRQRITDVYAATYVRQVVAAELMDEAQEIKEKAALLCQQARELPVEDLVLLHYQSLMKPTGDQG